jgi:hypothetical protein
MNKIIISSDSIEKITATLSDENPKSSEKLYNSLPIEGRANLWGDEIYFNIPLTVEEENARPVVEKGEIALGVGNSLFCIFFGKTPASTEDSIRPANPVNVVGRIDGDPKIFKKVSRGERINISKA